MKLAAPYGKTFNLLDLLLKNWVWWNCAKFLCEDKVVSKWNELTMTCLFPLFFWSLFLYFARLSYSSSLSIHPSGHSSFLSMQFKWRSIHNKGARCAHLFCVARLRLHQAWLHRNLPWPVKGLWVELVLNTFVRKEENEVIWEPVIVTMSCLKNE